MDVLPLVLLIALATPFVIGVLRARRSKPWF